MDILTILNSTMTIMSLLVNMAGLVVPQCIANYNNNNNINNNNNCCTHCVNGGCDIE